MKPFGVLMAAAALLLLNDTALAQERGSRDGQRNTAPTGVDRASRGDWHRGDRVAPGNNDTRSDWHRGDRVGPHRDADGRRDHNGRSWNHDGRGDSAHWRHRDRPHHHHGGRGYWGPRYHYSRTPSYWRSHPSWLYAAPAVPLYSYADWAEPIYVERVIEREPVYVERILETPREPAYAQATPRAQVEPSQPATPARLERYTLSATELFEFDKATLRMPQPKLDEIAAVMARNPQIDKVTISGYTDRIGTDAYNQKLSQKRADAVKAYLMQKGVAGSRLIAIGKGEADPVVQCSEKNQAALIKCLEPNRRVEVEQITVERRR